MFAGIDFPSAFTQDNFDQRRASGNHAGVAYNPESLISGKEAAEGLTALNSRRDFPTELQYHAATCGLYTTDEILTQFPRKRIDTPIIDSGDDGYSEYRRY